MDDRISSLPDEIICHIGSFLSAKEAAFAMVLSKRWRNLFTIIPELYFDDQSQESFTEFADRVFALPFNSLIKKFFIKWKVEEIEPAHINRCLSHALKHGVLDLELDVVVEKEEDRYSLPLDVFTCKTVAKLSLGRGLHIDFLPANAYLPALKSLLLHSVQIYEFDTLLSASPVLEELDIIDFKEGNCSRTVSSPTIKRLKFHQDFKDEGFDGDSEYQCMNFDTPALTYLDYSDFARQEYQIVNLNSLVEAKLEIFRHEDYLCDPTNLFEGIKNVEILSMTEDTMDVIDFFSEEVPVFENLCHLTLVSDDRYGWRGLRVLLRKSPKLKTFTIKGFLHFDNDGSDPVCDCLSGYYFLTTCRIEVFKITEFEGDTEEMLHLKHVLENSPYLELLEVHVQAGAESKRIKIEKDLLKIPRTSNCKIKVKSS